MELYSILLLITILSAIFLLTYFIKTIQKKRRLKIVDKQEPRFDLVAAPLISEFNSSAEETYLHSNYQENELNSGNLLLADPIMRKKVDIKKDTSKEVQTKKQKPSVDEIIFLILSSKPNKPYVGYELLQSLLATDLRYGAMNIFHRHEDPNGRGKILFSVASATEPGTFEINKIGAFSGKGLMMFLKLSHNKDIMHAFDIMLETAKQLIEDLDGDILDDERKILSNEKIEKIRKKVLDFEQKQLIGDLFEDQ